MNAPFQLVPAVDYLSLAAECARPILADRELSIGERLRELWAAVVAARDLGGADVVAQEFERLAEEAGLLAELGRNGREDVAHVVRWALLDQCPFQ